MTKEERELTITYLKDMQEEYIEGEGYERHPLPEWYALYKAIEVLEQTTWIPVSERLPKAGEYVEGVAKYYLVQNEYEDMLVARYTHSRYWEQIYQLEPIEDEIVAWMPLPQPYKAESEDKINGK